MTWIEEIRPSGDVAAEFVKYLKENKVGPSVIGFAGLKRPMPYHQYQFLLDSLPECKIVDADPLVDELRMVKSRMEVLQIRRAARIVGLAFDYIAHVSNAEQRENVLEAAARREARPRGSGRFQDDDRETVGRKRCLQTSRKIGP